jgi:hypothetical protein
MIKPKPFTELKNLTRPDLRVFAVDDILNLTRTTGKGNKKRSYRRKRKKKLLKIIVGRACDRALWLERFHISSH